MTSPQSPATPTEGTRTMAEQTATDLGYTENPLPAVAESTSSGNDASLCVGGHRARFTRPVRPTYHCGDPACACMAVPQTFAIMPQCPTHRVAKERRTIQTHSTTTGITEPMVFLVCPLCPDPFTGPSNA